MYRPFHLLLLFGIPAKTGPVHKSFPSFQRKLESRFTVAHS